MNMRNAVVLKYIFVFFTLITSSICHATCDRTETGSHPDFEANKKWPMHPHITISASASFQQAASYDDGFLDLLVEIKDSKTKKLSYYCAKNALSSDAMAIHKISIDTAPYILSKSTHAFGVRSYNSNNSQSNPASIQTITLFGVRDGKVVLLLDTIDMGGHFNEVSLREECKGTFITQKRIISISKTTHNGLSDLEVTEINDEGELSLESNECIEKSEGTYTKKYILQFNGEKYDIPFALKS